MMRHPQWKTHIACDADLERYIASVHIDTAMQWNPIVEVVVSVNVNCKSICLIVYVFSLEVFFFMLHLLSF